MLKPEFFLDETLAQLEPYTKLLFIGLWTLADREGRLEDRPVKIRAQLFPYDPEADVEGMLCSLALEVKEATRTGFIVRYEIEGKRYIQIRAFKAHQKPHHKEPLSVIPPTPVAGVKTPDGVHHVPEIVRNGSNSQKPGTAPAKPVLPGQGRDEASKQGAPCLPESESESLSGVGVFTSDAPTSAVAEVLVPASKWNNESAEDWRELMHGDPFPGQFKPILRLVQRHTWAVVRPRWRLFLSQLEARYANAGAAAKFEATFGSWTQAPARASPKAQEREHAANVEIAAGKVQVPVGSMLEGLIRDRAKLGRGDATLVGEPARPRLESGDEKRAGSDPPERVEPLER